MLVKPKILQVIVYRIRFLLLVSELMFVQCYVTITIAALMILFQDITEYAVHIRFQINMNMLMRFPTYLLKHMTKLTTQLPLCLYIILKDVQTLLDLTLMELSKLIALANFTNMDLIIQIEELVALLFHRG